MLNINTAHHVEKMSISTKQLSKKITLLKILHCKHSDIEKFIIVYRLRRIEYQRKEHRN